MSDGDNQGAESPNRIALPLAFDIPEGVVSRYVTNLLVQAGEHEIVVSFFEVITPPLLGSPESNEEVLRHLGRVPTSFAGRFVISPERMQSFIDALQTGFNTYKALKGNDEGEQG